MVKLSQLLQALKEKEVSDPQDTEIERIFYDSRKIKKNSLFVAIKGFRTDGHRFINQALLRGAKAVVMEKRIPLGEGATGILVPDTREALALLADRFYHHPSRKIKLIGITGTNGKTTTSYLTHSILTSNKKGCGLLGTIAHKIGSKTIPAQITTPESLDLQFLLSQLVEKKIKYAVMEVSSHSLELSRIERVKFSIAVFTNLSIDHLDFHQTIENYLEAKTRLFTRLGKRAFAIINIDDPRSRYIKERTPCSILTYGIERKADVKARKINLSLEGSSFKVKTPEGDLDINLPLPGKHNVYNALAAIGVSSLLKIPPSAIEKGLERVRNIPGRFERIDEGQDFWVIVDYAHTDNALERVLATCRELIKGRIILVFGCGGDRDRSKRPLMGEAAAKYSDCTIITNDNPRSEEPLNIASSIEVGIKRGNGRYTIILDRREAIRRGMEEAAPGDLVLIAGKGHETTQTIGTQVLPFDDREVARKILKDQKIS
jgi:UDP-N-acetylmuramoyl-L-alanyl-D-glutamate--2,6-diaminopimelate ligase